MFERLHKIKSRSNHSDNSKIVLIQIMTANLSSFLRINMNCPVHGENYTGKCFQSFLKGVLTNFNFYMLIQLQNIQLIQKFYEMQKL